MTYSEKEKTKFIKVISGLFCLLLIYILADKYSDGFGKDEFNHLIGNINKDSNYFLYQTSVDAKQENGWIRTGKIGDIFYSCLKNSSVREGGGVANSKNYYMVLKGDDTDYLLKLNIVDDERVYYFSYMYIPEDGIGLGHIKTNQTKSTCYLPNNQK